MRVRALLFLVVAAVLSMAAQQGGMGQGPGPKGPGRGMQYDPAKETKITGTIEEIKTIDTMCHGGTHVVLKTAQGNVEVGLGPSKFLEQQKLELKKGDTLEVTGQKITRPVGDIFVARQVTNAGKTFDLRDAKGIPAWPRGACRQ